MSASSPSAPHASDDHFLGACLRLNLGLDLIAAGGMGHANWAQLVWY